MTEQEMCKAICKAASDKKARDIATMDMQGLMISPDYFVICSANTATQVRAIADNIEEELAKDGVAFSHKEGYRDFGDVVVHVFRQEMREYYALEQLWGDAKLTAYEE